MKGKKISYILVAVVIVLIIVAIVGKKSGTFGKEKLLTVTTEKAELRQIIEKVTANGKIQPETEVKISPDVSGEIVDLRVKEGDFVNKGDLLLKIKPDTYISMKERATASLNTAKAQLSSATAQFETNKLVYERSKKLWDQKAISDAEYEGALSQFNVSKANLEAAQFGVKSSEASLKEANENLSKTTIYAPISGTVSKLNIESGERVVGTAQMAGTELLRIADLNRMEVKVDVNENDIVKVKLNDTTDIEIDAYIDHKFTGIVTEIANSASVAGSSADQVTTFDVKILILQDSYKNLKNGKNPFRPGMSASVDIRTNQVYGALSVPIQAVTVRNPESGMGQKDDNDLQESRMTEVNDEEIEKDRASMKEVVFVLNEDQTISSIEVKTAIQDDKFIQIVSGIDSTKTVITGPYSAITKKLKDGMKVETEKKKSLIRSVS